MSRFRGNVVGFIQFWGGWWFVWIAAAIFGWYSGDLF